MSFTHTYEILKRSKCDGLIQVTSFIFIDKISINNHISILKQ